MGNAEKINHATPNNQLLEMRIFAAKLLQNYQWDLLPDQNLDLVTVPTPHPKDGLKVSFSRLK